MIFPITCRAEEKNRGQQETGGKSGLALRGMPVAGQDRRSAPYTLNLQTQNHEACALQPSTLNSKP